MQHLFTKGAVVNIFQMSHNKGLLFEGKATVLKPVGDGSDEHYMVRFHGGDGKPARGADYERFIDRDGQEDSDQYIREFNKRIGYKAA